MTISDALRAIVRAQAGNRCGYCLARQEYVPWTLEIEHIVPKSKGGTDDKENLTSKLDCSRLASTRGLTVNMAFAFSRGLEDEPLEQGK